GMVTHDKYYVFQRDDGAEVVVRNLGSKTKKIIYDAKGGTKEIDVDKNDVNKWALSITQAEDIAKAVRIISKAYGSMIMDTEFCFDANEELWFVQARPETRWNEELELHPHTIFMRRLEVDEKAAEKAEVILEGNGASRGAGQGTVRFLRSALELNKVGKGDILAAERTDPDMVPGMRVASAILADVGGDTSHAAITSRELGIAAVIGIQRNETLRALDGQEVTVDGTRGRVYRGLLPLHEIGGEMDLTKLPKTKTHVGLVLADVTQALFLSRLRTVEDFEVGLLRAEFMLGNVAVHPKALEAYDNGSLEDLVSGQLATLENSLTKVMQEQLSSGLVTLDLKMRDHVGRVTGLAQEIEAAVNYEPQGTEEVLAQQRKIRELEHKLDEYFENALRYQDTLRTSSNLSEHIRIIFGYEEELNAFTGSSEEKLSEMLR
ncbi:MAG: phosphoenolpyruvate synthase, partial [Mailhella sp.]|nr:phosphoenolpyruvate synthase [Mailhella sp.]